MISSDQISFVVQGAVDKKKTSSCLRSIRKHFPTSCIILSTWEGSDVAELDFDKLVLSKDPGFFYVSKQPGAKANNVNRQIVSTLAGLQQAETPFSFKLRTDFAILGCDFLKYFNHFPKADPEFQIFDSKIVALGILPDIPPYFLFHPGDMAFFGNTQDLKNLFDIPLMPQEDVNYNPARVDFCNRYIPEQHIFIQCLRKNGKNPAFEHFGDCSEENILETERYFASNFIFLTPNQFQLLMLKVDLCQRVGIKNFRYLYTHNEWLKLYQRYLDPDITIAPRDPGREEFDNFLREYRKYKILARLLTLPYKFLGLFTSAPVISKYKYKIRGAILKYFLCRKGEHELPDL